MSVRSGIERIPKSRLPVILTGIQGVLVIGMWAGYIFGGVFKDGLKTVENRQYLIFHVIAELLMGFLLAAGSVGLLRNRSWGRPVDLVGLGAAVYSTINSLADTVRNRQGLTPVLLLNLGVAIASAIMLVIRGSGQPERG